jgi:hypothetical protein
MHWSVDRGDLEQETIAAHNRYIAALAQLERVQCDVRRAVPGVTEHDLLAARVELDRQFFELWDRLDVLGYTPRGLTTRLPPEPGTDA